MRTGTHVTFILEAIDALRLHLCGQQQYDPHTHTHSEVTLHGAIIVNDVRYTM